MTLYIRTLIRRLFSPRYWPYSVIFLACLATIIVWYLPGKLLFFADSTWPVGNPLKHAYDYLYGWRQSFSGGVIDLTGYSIVPLFFFIGVLQWLGLSPVIAQAIFFFLVLFAAGAGTVALLRYLGARYAIRERPLAIVICALFYMSNLYIAINGWRMIIFLYVFYAMLPILVLTFLKYLDTEKLKFAVALALITSLIVSVALTNLSYLFILVGILGSLGFLFVGKKKLLRLVWLYIVALLIWVPINIWYLAPQLTNISDSASKATGGDAAGSLSILDTTSTHASIINLLSVNGQYSLYDTVGGPWFSWAHLFTESPFAVFTLLFPAILALVGLGMKSHSKSRRLTLLGFAFVLGGVLLAKGSHAPFGQLFFFLIEHFPVPFLAFRAAYEKLGVIIIIGLLILLFRFLSLPPGGAKHRYTPTEFIVLGFVLVLGFPIWTGSIFSSDNGTRPSARIQIPDDYRQAASFLQKDPQALALSLPLQHHTWTSAKWQDGKQGYLGNDILRLLSRTPIISTETGDPDIDEFNTYVEKDLTTPNVDIANLAARQVKYIVVHKDANYNWGLAYGYRMPKISTLLGQLDKSGHFVRKFDSHNLAIYELTSPGPHDYIYATDMLYSFNDNNELSGIDHFIRSTFSDDYMFTSKPGDAPSRPLIPLFANIQPKDLHLQSGEISQKISSSPIQSATLYKMNTPYVLTVTPSARSIVLQSKPDGVLSVGGTPQFDQQANTRQLTIATNDQEDYVVGVNGRLTILRGAAREFTYPDHNADIRAYGVSKYNLVDTKSGSDNPWSGLENCAADGQHAQISATKDSRDPSAITLSAATNIACSHVEAQRVTGGKYLLTFDYKSDTNSSVGFTLQHKEPGKYKTEKTFLSSDRSWHTYSEIIAVPANSNGVNLFVYAFASNGLDKNTASYRNVRISKITNETTAPLAQPAQAKPQDLGNLASNTNASFSGSADGFADTTIRSWSNKVHDCGKSTKAESIALQLSNNNRQIKLTSGGHIACTFATVPVTSLSDYLVSMRYNSNSDLAAGYYVEFNDRPRTSVSQHLKRTDGEWRSESEHIKVPQNATNATIYLYAFEPETGGNSIAHYSDVHFTKFTSVTTSYILVGDSNVNAVKPKSITYTIDNPTKRTITAKGVTGNFYLGMNSSYNTSWVMQTKDGSQKGINHFKANGFQNGWYVNAALACRQAGNCIKHTDGSYEILLTATFTPQNKFYKAALISGGAVGLSVLGLAFHKLHRRKHMKQKHFERISI